VETVTDLPDLDGADSVRVVAEYSSSCPWGRRWSARPARRT
jgi:hypothetical protein